MEIKTISLSVTAPIPFDGNISPSAVGACDLKGRCYWGRLIKGTWRWRYGDAPGNGSTHWLPANTSALPVRLPRKH
jgi:hypothetical protein